MKKKVVFRHALPRITRYVEIHTEMAREEVTPEILRIVKRIFVRIDKLYLKRLKEAKA